MGFVYMIGSLVIGTCKVIQFVMVSNMHTLVKGNNAS